MEKEQPSIEKSITTPKIASSNEYMIPGAIVIAGIIIALAVVSTGASGAVQPAQQAQGGGVGNNVSPTATNVREISKQDHVFGPLDAKVTIIEYSDFECPFCQRIHPTLTRIVEEYQGEVNWVYRHFPLTSIHSQALSASIASECVAALGGNDAFWEFGTRMFENQRGLGQELYTTVATDLGVDESAFTECFEQEEFRGRVDLDRQNAIDSGGRGTPFNIVTTNNGDTFPFSGALPYESIKQIVDQALAG